MEDGNVNSDNWVPEHRSNPVCSEPGGDACGFYHRYPADIATVAALGFKAFLVGVEWSRIEPESGLISTAAPDRYSRAVDACLAHDVTPVVTLHHFTRPRWVISAGG